MKNIIYALLFFLFSFSIHAERNLEKYYGFDQLEIIKLDWDISCLNICDINNDGLNDLIVANNRKSKIEILIQKRCDLSDIYSKLVDTNTVDVENINDLGESDRFERRELLVTVKISSMSCCDVNNDGLTDIIYYGDPRGLYVHHQVKSEVNEIKFSDRIKYDIDDGLSGQFSLDCGDIDGNGENDIVLGSKRYLYFLYQQNGKLSGPVKYPISWTPLSVEIDDINSDGLNDILCITDNKNKSVVVRYGIEGGRLGPLIQYDIERPIAYKMFNIDDKASDEMLYIDQISGRLTGYRFEKSQQSEDTATVFYYPLETGSNIKDRNIITGDFDGDKLDDIIVSNPESAEISVYFQDTRSGFFDPKYFGSLADISSICPVDVNRDGKDEIIVLSAKESTVGISYYTDERFTFPETIPLDESPVAMTADDVDEDGQAELICVTRDKDGKRFLNLVREFTGAVEVFTLELKDLSADPEGIICADVDNSGTKDCILFIKYDKPITVLVTDQGSLEVLEPSESNSSLIKDATLSNTTVSNIDNKGGILLCQNNYIRHLTVNQEGKWQVVDQFNADQREDKMVSIGTCNLDKDADIEIVTYNSNNKKLQIFNKSKNNLYSVDYNIDTGAWDVTSIRTVFINPGQADTENIVLFDGEKFALLDFRKKSTDNYPSIHQFFSYETKVRAGGYGRIAVGDINSDKVPDVVLVEYKKNHIEILTFKDASVNPDPVSAMVFRIYEEKNFRDEAPKGSMVEPRMVYVADVTGDKANDIIAVIHDRIIIYPQDIEP